MTGKPREPLRGLIERNRGAIKDLARRNRGIAISLFGSAARGADTEASDADFLVQFEPGSSLFDLLLLFDSPLDGIEETDTELNHARDEDRRRILTLRPICRPVRRLRSESRMPGNVQRNAPVSRRARALARHRRIRSGPAALPWQAPPRILVRQGEPNGTLRDRAPVLRCYRCDPRALPAGPTGGPMRNGGGAGLMTVRQVPATAAKGEQPMRPLRYSINVTLDGCCDHREAIPDEELHRHHAANLERADALLFGRVTYEMMEAAWRQLATGTWPDWMADWMIPFARTIDGAKKYVVSGTLDRVDWNAELVQGDLEKAVQQLKQEPGKGLFTGGVTLPLALADLGLIDEYEFVVQPILAGHGPTLFAGLRERLELKLVGRQEFRSGAVALSYQPRRVTA